MNKSVAAVLLVCGLAALCAMAQNCQFTVGGDTFALASLVKPAGDYSGTPANPQDPHVYHVCGGKGARARACLHAAPS
jgi:hypothetical protein